MGGDTPRTVGILIFPEVEVLDFCGPFEVFASASRPPATDGGTETRLFDVRIIAEKPEVVRCRGGLLVQPHHTFTDHPPLDILSCRAATARGRSRRTRWCSIGFAVNGQGTR